MSPAEDMPKDTNIQDRHGNTRHIIPPRSDEVPRDRQVLFKEFASIRSVSTQRQYSGPVTWRCFSCSFIEVLPRFANSSIS